MKPTSPLVYRRLTQVPQPPVPRKILPTNSSDGPTNNGSDKLGVPCPQIGASFHHLSKDIRIEASLTLEELALVLLNNSVDVPRRLINWVAKIPVRKHPILDVRCRTGRVKFVKIHVSNIVIGKHNIADREYGVITMAMAPAMPIKRQFLLDS